MKKIILIIFVFLVFTSVCYSQDSLLQVSIEVDKESYDQGEVVKITLRNDLSENVFSQIGSHTPVFSIDSIEKKDSIGDWEKLFAQCQYPHCIYDMDGPVEIESMQSVSFDWNPLIYLDGTDKYIQAKSGMYRLLILYQTRKGTSSEDWKWLKVYSNEFIIN
ncbi:MAG: hypothetical protein P9X22_08875 [Candidatus Zapsychrus exili]|nr:hypothetical protein [Candidatus Zapsychrus exili]